MAVEDQESENKLIVQNELGQTEYRFSLGLGEKPAVGKSSRTLLKRGQKTLIRAVTHLSSPNLFVKLHFSNFT